MEGEHAGEAVVAQYGEMQKAGEHRLGLRGLGNFLADGLPKGVLVDGHGVQRRKKRGDGTLFCGIDKGVSGCHWTVE